MSAFSRFFIDRPIFAAVISIVIVITGLLALQTLPIAQYPEIAPPTVSVTCTYTGASATVVADTVAAPIEQQVIGVERMLYMSSQSTNDGVYSLTVTFENGVDLDIAQVQVQNRYGHNLMHLGFPQARHSERDWGFRLHLPMQFLNGAVARASRLLSPVLSK